MTSISKFSTIVVSIGTQSVTVSGLHFLLSPEKVMSTLLILWEGSVRERGLLRLRFLGVGELG